MIRYRFAAHTQGLVASIVFHLIKACSPDGMTRAEGAVLNENEMDKRINIADFRLENILENVKEEQ